MLKNILIFGAGDQGKEVAYYLERINQEAQRYNILGFLDDNEEIHGKVIYNHKILGGLEWLDKKELTNVSCIIALGDPQTKQKIEKKLTNFNLQFESIIDPSAIVDQKTLDLGKGAIIAPGVIILPDVKIGDHVLVNYNTVIGHDCKIGRFSTLAPNVTLAGKVSIQKGAYIGLGSNIIQGLSVGEWTIIGAGATVIRDLPPKVVAVGTPAKPVKQI